MKRTTVHIYEGRPAEEEAQLTSDQMCDRCSISIELLKEIVDEGILEPMGHSQTSWKFEFSSVERVKKVIRLQRDLELNLSAVALAIHLLDRIEHLEYRLRQLE